MTDERPFVDEDHDAADEPIVGPGSGGSPTSPGQPDPDDRREAAADPDVRAVLDSLRSDEPGRATSTVDDAAEQAGSGTDR